MSLCVACHQKIELCECVWSAVPKLQSNISQCIDVKMMQTEIQRNEEWQTVFRKLIDDLFDYFHNINERVMLIEKVRIEPIAVTKEYADKVIKGSDELQENVNAAFWYNQATQLKEKVFHLEQCLKDKSESITNLVNQIKLLSARLGNFNGGCCL